MRNRYKKYVEEDEDSDIVVPSIPTLTTRTGRQIRVVVKLDRMKNQICIKFAT